MPQSAPTHVTYMLMVEDAERARRFYRDGLTATVRWAAPDGSWTVMEIGGREVCTTARSDLLGRAETTGAAAPTFLVPVREMPRAIAFYRDALGFSVLRRSPDDTWAEVGDDATTIGLHRADVAGVDTGLGLLV